LPFLEKVALGTVFISENEDKNENGQNQQAPPLIAET
jgi:hypothetical protein